MAIALAKTALFWANERQILGAFFRPYRDEVMERFAQLNKGQTAVEYLLLLALAASLVFSVMSTFRKKFWGDPKLCARRENSNLFSCRMQRLLGPGPEDQKRFQTYHLTR